MKGWEEEGRVKKEGKNNNYKRQKIRGRKRREREQTNSLQSLLQASLVTEHIPTCCSEHPLPVNQRHRFCNCVCQ